MWTTADRVKAMVWKAEQSQRCGQCGTYTWEWQYQDEEGEWKRRHDVPLEADYWTCMGCRDIGMLWDQVTDYGKQRPKHGTQVRWFPPTPSMNGGHRHGDE